MHTAGLPLAMIFWFTPLQNIHPTLKRICLLIGVVVCAWAACGPALLTAQVTDAGSDVAPPQAVQLKGLVTARKKYSFTVKQNRTEYSVKLAPGAPIGLKMNKPRFDWDQDRVVVLPMEYSTDQLSEPAVLPKRVALQLPAEELFLISRFDTAFRIQTIMSADVKRINFYLVTPDDPGQHFPTEQQPYLSGPLSLNDQQLQVKIEDQLLPVKLGVHYATMNGFTINQLEPNQTHVILSGHWSDGATDIEATSVLFRPVVVPEIGPNQNDDPFSLQPAVK